MAKQGFLIVVSMFFVFNPLLHASQMRIDNSQQEKFSSKDFALFNAAINGDLKKMNAALQAGARINLQDQHSKTALMYAAQLGKMNSVRYLVAAGADLSIKNMQEQGKTVVHYAKNKRAIQRAIEEGLKGRDTFSLDNIPPTRETLYQKLEEAVYSNDRDRLLSALADGADINSQDEYKNTPLMHAIAHKSNNLIKPIVEAGADLNIQDSNGYTALMKAIELGGPKNLVDFLIQQGASIYMTNNIGKPAFMIAMDHGRLDIAQTLLDHGALANVKDAAGNTALRYAVGSRDSGRVDFLVKHGADLNTKGSGGVTALMFAVKNNFPEMVRSLVAAGADPDIKNEQESNKIAFDYANEENKKTMQEAIETGIALRKTPEKANFFYSISAGNF